MSSLFPSTNTIYLRSYSLLSFPVLQSCHPFLLSFHHFVLSDFWRTIPKGSLHPSLLVVCWCKLYHQPKPHRSTVLSTVYTQSYKIPIILYFSTNCFRIPFLRLFFTSVPDHSSQMSPFMSFPLHHLQQVTPLPANRSSLTYLLHVLYSLTQAGHIGIRLHYNFFISHLFHHFISLHPRHALSILIFFIQYEERQHISAARCISHDLRGRDTGADPRCFILSTEQKHKLPDINFVDSSVSRQPKVTSLDHKGVIFLTYR